MKWKIKNPEKQVYTDDTHWAKLRIKKDRGEDYIDILIGKKGKTPHAHLGINLDQSFRFFEDRLVVASVSRDVKRKDDSVPQEEIYQFPGISGEKTLRFKFHIDGREDKNVISIDSFEFEQPAK